MPVAGTGRDGRTDFSSQSVRHALVGIDLEYPLAATGLYAGIPPVALDRPIAVDQTIGEPRGNIARAVGAVIEQHDNLVSKGKPLQAVGKLSFLVANGDNGGQETIFSDHAPSYSRKTG